MSKLFKRKVLLVITIIFMSIILVQVSRANIFDDFLIAIGITSEKEETVQESIESVSKEVEKYLGDRQKEVITKIEDIYNDLQNVNIDDIANSIDYKIPTQIKSNLEYFFDNFKDALANLKSILGTVKYKVDDVRNDGDKVVAKITFNFPSIKKLITKIIPEIIMKNASALFGGEINNDTIDSVLGSVKKELDKGSYEIETYTREFVFEQFGDEWKLVNVGDIVKDVNNYINNIAKSFFK